MHFLCVFSVFAFIFTVGTKAVDWRVFKFYIASKHESQRLLSTSGLHEHIIMSMFGQLMFHNEFSLG